MKKIIFMAIVLVLFLVSYSLAQEEINLPQLATEEPKELKPPQLQGTRGSISQPADTEKGPVAETSETKTISLDLKGMDILDVLKMLAMRANLNIVVGKNVTGRVTIFLKDVAPMDALEIILISNELAYEKKGDIISVMTSRDYETKYGERFQENKDAAIIALKFAKASNMLVSLNQVKSNIGRVVADEGSNTVILLDFPDKIDQMKKIIQEMDRPTQTRIFDLNYAHSDKIKEQIQEVVSKGSGSIKIDERTNKIAITDYPEKLAEIEKVINAFDEKTKQVLIDSKIIEVKLSDKFEMGIDWDAWLKESLRVGNAFSLSTTTGGKLTVGTTTIDAVGNYKTVVQLLQTVGETRILSSPRVTAVNNQEAKILVGSKEAYITQTTSQAGTGSTITAESVNFVDVGVQLYVTPTINRDGFVTMKIRPVVSSASYKSLTSGGTTSEIPIVSTSEAETVVMVRDGTTIIIAGLMKDEKYKTVKKTPLLGDIPFLGSLFRNTSDEVKKTELAIFLTPHIISGVALRSQLQENAQDLYKSQITSQPSVDFLSESGVGFLEYAKTVREKILEKASQILPQKGTFGNVCVSFVLLTDGSLKDQPKVIEISDKALEPFAIRAVQEAYPFPAFPQGLNKKEEFFQIVISYE
ncbi:MAG: secretin N-terminal domain-containing protein [Candidatus Omnitrophota bacterium]